MAEKSYFTKEGLEKLKKELNRLKTKERTEIAKQIQETREKGDLSENAEYDAAKEAQQMLEMRIAKMENTLSNARLMDDTDLDTSKVLALSKVEIKNLKTGKSLHYILVSETEADVKTGKLSVTSPIGKGLLGKSAGDVVEVTTPAGVVKFEVIAVSR